MASTLNSVQRNRIYREAAKRALDGYAFKYLASKGLSYHRFIGPIGWWPTMEERCLLLCFAAAMAETGDEL